MSKLPDRYRILSYLPSGDEWINSITQLTSGVSKRFLDYVDSLGMDTYFVGDMDAAGLKFSKYRPGGFITERDLDEYPTEKLRELLLGNIK